ncbi:---NA--- [Podarcis lilfordi]|uniref:---NA n=1 Tax=Podarcis lilfordi TaxID=74358 RepID=A0AA35L8F0_9SAUR|nr:---NA--- [Podarcis lilfordi]
MMELLVQVASTCRLPQTALQKVLVAGSYDVDKNSCFKNLMSQGMLVQSSSTGTLGSFRLSKDQASTLEGKKKAVAQKPTGVAKPVKGSPKKAVKKPKASQAKKVATKSQAKVEAVEPKMPKAKMAKLKRVVPKRK